MANLIEVPLDAGGKLLIEADDTRSTIMRGTTTEERVARVAVSFEESLRNVRPAVEALVDRMRDSTDRPSEITVEFGLKFNVEAGMVVARTGAEASFRVMLTWCGPAEDDRRPGS